MDSVPDVFSEIPDACSRSIRILLSVWAIQPDGDRTRLGCMSFGLKKILTRSRVCANKNTDNTHKLLNDLIC